MMRHTSAFVAIASLILSTALASPSSSTRVKTTSGILEGAEQHGVTSFKGIPYAHAPVGSLRWEPPKAFTSASTRKATVLGPSCIQQFSSAKNPNLIESLFNNPPPPESEDCLFLNVWTPSQKSGNLKPVVVFIYGGGFAFGTASLPVYDGTSIAQNQDIIVVSFNYRSNAFGFPGAEELFQTGENLGFLDQDLALQWVQLNIKAFGGDPKKVTIMGQSSGAVSVAHAIQRHSTNVPFRAAIMHSGAAVPLSPDPSFASFGALAQAVNCTQSPGAERIACLKAVSADTIHTWLNGPQGVEFNPVADEVTVFAEPIQRIQQKQTARVPILIGALQDDASPFVVGETSLPDFLNSEFGSFITPDEVRALYPGLNDTKIIETTLRDLAFVCPAELTTGAFVQSGLKDVFRYIYGKSRSLLPAGTAVTEARNLSGAVFADMQPFFGAGAWHQSELFEIFGTFNATTATPAEKTLSQTMQKVWANFIKDPTAPPAPNWPKYVPGNTTNTLAKLAYSGNVKLSNVVQRSSSALDDTPCDKLWDAIL